MHARWLVEIATLFVIQTKVNEQNSLGLLPSASHRYWAVSRQRFERWQTLLTDYREGLENAGASQRVAIWRSLRPLFEEIFLSDVLTRILACYGARLEADAIDADLGPIAHNVFVTHEDIRNRCLRMLVSPGVPIEQSIELNRIRHSLEHWSDTFMAQFSQDTTRLEYSFMAERTAELIDEAKERASDSSKLVAWQLMIGSCQKWMQQHCRTTSASSSLNQQLGESVLAMLHPERFPSIAPFPLAFADRVTTLIDQANLWLNQLITPSPIPLTVPPTSK
jgi:hypothetical protein